MIGQDNIWRNLQDYELPPPPELRDKVEQLLKKEQDAAAAMKPGSLERLALYEVQPPETLRSSVESIIYKNGIAAFPLKQGAAGKAGRTFSLYSYRGIAACLVLAAAAWGIYRISTVKKNLPAVAYRKPAAGSSNNGHVPSPLPLTANDTPANATAAAQPGEEIKPGTNYLPHFSPRIEGQSFTLSDNDLIASFTSFDYNKIPDFITRNDNREVKVHLDQYDNLLISVPMAGMLKEMYQLKPGGKPTRKARKRRERLDRWKKTDETYFDQSPKNNPLDPIDLGRFIFK